ncbi:hypothetical protein MKZ38_010791 [Zalerion maritima]|uniref:Uncharacterized protein n=1 Tax=Zalerion maritima TaxID=339359 RepID=A0AAD5RZL6_9PEZI|nr:hypothetical protein MKZ38_010791 [Zalerion maritima]
MIDECQVTLKISFVKVKGAYGTDELFLPVWRAGRMIAGIWRPMMAKGAREVLFLEARIVTLLLDLDRKLVWRKGDDWLVMGEVLAGMRERSWVLEIEGKEVDVDWRDKEEDIATRQGVEEKVERIVLLDNERPPIRRKADSNEEERAGRDVSDKGLKDGGDDVSPPRLTGTPLSLLHRPKPHSMEGRHGEREVDELTGVLVLVDLSDAEYSSDDGFGGGGGGSKLTG